MKPTYAPTAYYCCKFCVDDQAHPASDLYWSAQHGDWVCEMCWEDEHLIVDGHGIRLDEYLVQKEIAVITSILDRAVPRQPDA